MALIISGALFFVLFNSAHAGDSISSTPISCDTSFAGAVMSELCKTFKCSGATKACTRDSLELFAGTDLNNPNVVRYVGNPLQGGRLTPVLSQTYSWQDTFGFGGSGNRMATGALCVLNDLGDHPLTLSKTAGFATASLKMERTSFDPTNLSWEGYQHLNICAPPIPCFDAVGQKLTADLIHSDYAANSTMDNRVPITKSWGVRLSAVDSNESVAIESPTFSFDTFLGKLSFSIKYAFQSALGVHAPSFQGEAGVGPVIKDLRGRQSGVSFTQNPGNSLRDGGWTSLAAFGQRDSSAAKWVYDPTIASRPDIDFRNIGFTPRDSSELKPSATVSADYCLTYSPLDLLPPPMLALRKIPGVDFRFDIKICPRLSATASSQFQLYMSESDYSKSNSNDYNSLAFFDTGVKVDSSLNATLDVKLKAEALDQTIVDVNKSYSKKVESSSGSDFRAAEVSTDNQFPLLSTGNYTKISTLTGAGYVGATAHDMVTSCLNSKPASKQEPSPQVNKPDATAIFNLPVFPCNICAVSNGFAGHGQVFAPGANTVLPSIDSWRSKDKTKYWSCDLKHNGCFDLCAVNPSAKTFLLSKSAVEMDGGHCSQSTIPNK